MSTSFLTNEEIAEIGFRRFGRNVLISRFARFYAPELMEIGNDVRIDDFCILSGKVVLGNNIHIGAYSALYGKYEIELQDHTGLSPRCTLFSASDDFSGEYMISPMAPPEHTNVMGGKITMEKFVQIGAGCIILPNLTISQGTAVGAMSLVRKSLEEWNIYTGNPLRFVKKRKKTILERYEAIHNNKK